MTKEVLEKILYTLIFFLILISPIIINKILNNYVLSQKINKNYFSIQAIGSLISKQEKFLIMITMVCQFY